VAENIVRHEPSGGLYLQAKVDGKAIRKSFGLSSLPPTKLKRHRMLAELRIMGWLAPPVVRSVKRIRLPSLWPATTSQE